MTIIDLFQEIRDNLKDADTDSTAHIDSALLGRAVLAGIRRIQSHFPETRLDQMGRLRPAETVAYTSDTAAALVNGQLPTVPLPMEFERALVAFVMEWAHARDARDKRDMDLAKHWQRRYEQLTGEKLKG